MANFYLIRHAVHDALGERLTGRSPGVSLDREGRAQAQELAERLKGEHVTRVQASPRERASETAEFVARACGLTPIETTSALDEVDFGTWSGMELAALSRDPAWRRWNEHRARARTPGGERMLDVQERVVGHMARMACEMRDEIAVLVTHAEVIRAALLHWLELSLDDWPRIEIAPASISKVALDEQGARVIAINEVVA